MKSRAFVGSVIPEGETRAARKARETEMRERLAAAAPPKPAPSSLDALLGAFGSDDDENVKADEE